MAGPRRGPPTRAPCGSPAANWLLPDSSRHPSIEPRMMRKTPEIYHKQPIPSAWAENPQRADAVTEAIRASPGSQPPARLAGKLHSRSGSERCSLRRPIPHSSGKNGSGPASPGIQLPKVSTGVQTLEPVLSEKTEIRRSHSAWHRAAPTCKWLGPLVGHWLRLALLVTTKPVRPPPCSKSQQPSSALWRGQRNQQQTSQQSKTTESIDKLPSVRQRGFSKNPWGHKPPRVCSRQLVSAASPLLALALPPWRSPLCAPIVSGSKS